MNLIDFFLRELNVFFGGRYTWSLLSLQDVKSRYRRSVIGPFWITLTSIFFVAGLGTVYSRLLGLNLQEYLPYLATGIIVWTFITSLISEGANSLISAAGIIKQINLPYMTHVVRIVFRNFIVFLHSWIILIPLLMWYGYLTVYGFFVSIFGVLLVLFSLTPLVTLLAVLCARYRDVVPMIASGLQLLFFVTPVMWHAEQLSGLEVVIKYNIFNYFIDVVREPMLKGYFPLHSAEIVFFFGAVCWVAAFLAVFVNRKKIPYWL
ncbi:ABC transporter permease [Pseudomonas congelans]|uniref:ABC transporter permease n=1 Tax=Pseudomonas congelans TaxID=200452 RepID=UPI000ABBB8D3|nr:ABC transporter permease [Pseudomonas congelans]